MCNTPSASGLFQSAEILIQRVLGLDQACERGKNLMSYLPGTACSKPADDLADRTVRELDVVIERNRLPVAVSSMTQRLVSISSSVFGGRSRRKHRSRPYQATLAPPISRPWQRSRPNVQAPTRRGLVPTCTAGELGRMLVRGAISLSVGDPRQIRRTR